MSPQRKSLWSSGCALWPRSDPCCGGRRGAWAPALTHTGAPQVLCLSHVLFTVPNLCGVAESSASFTCTFHGYAIVWGQPSPATISRAVATSYPERRAPSSAGSSFVPPLGYSNASPLPIYVGRHEVRTSYINTQHTYPLVRFSAFHHFKAPSPVPHPSSSQSSHFKCLQPACRTCRPRLTLLPEASGRPSRPSLPPSPRLTTTR